jgi:hypothetical protein
MSLISPLNEIQCLMCGKYFIPNAKHQKYCNKACLQKANIKRRNMYYKNVEKLRKAKSEELKERKQKQNDFDMLLHEIYLYNLKNNCFLSYGEYVNKFNK